MILFNMLIPELTSNINNFNKTYKTFKTLHVITAKRIVFIDTLSGKIYARFAEYVQNRCFLVNSRGYTHYYCFDKII